MATQRPNAAKKPPTKPKAAGTEAAALRVTYAESAEPQDVTVTLGLVPQRGVGLQMPFEEAVFAQWMNAGAGVGASFAPGATKVEVVAPLDTRLAADAGLVLRSFQLRVTALCDEAVLWMAREALRPMALGANASIGPLATVVSVDIVGSRPAELRTDDAVRSAPFPRTGVAAPPFAFALTAQKKTDKRSVTIRTTRLVKGADDFTLDMTLQLWATIVDRYLEAAKPKERLLWLDTDGGSARDKTVRFPIRRKDYEDVVAFAWPFDVALPAGLLRDLLTVVHLGGTRIAAVDAAL